MNDGFTDAFLHLQSGSFMIKMEKFLGDKLQCELERNSKELKTKLKPTGCTIATSIKLFKEEVGDAAFNAIANNPELLNMVKEWEHQCKEQNAEILIAGLLSIVPPEHAGEITRDEVNAFLACNWPGVEK